MMPPFSLDDPAGQLALLTVLLAAVWKVWFRMRADHRGDRQGVRDHQSQETASKIYDGLITQLREEVNRLATTVHHLSVALDEEREARRTAESRADQLQERVDVLERQLGFFTGGGK